MKCIQCGNDFEGRSDAKTCSKACRIKYHRNKGSVTDNELSVTPETLSVTEPVTDKVIPVTANTVKEVEQKLESLTKGQQKEQRDSGWRCRTDLYRRAKIDRIQAGEAEGSVERHPEYGWLIYQTVEQAKAYEAKYPGRWVLRVGKKSLPTNNIKNNFRKKLPFSYLQMYR